MPACFSYKTNENLQREMISLAHAELFRRLCVPVPSCTEWAHHANASAQLSSPPQVKKARGDEVVARRRHATAR